MTQCKTEWFAQISITLLTRSTKMYVTLIKTSSIQKQNAAPNQIVLSSQNADTPQKSYRTCCTNNLFYEDILVGVNCLSVITEVRNVQQL